MIYFILFLFFVYYLNYHSTLVDSTILHIDSTIDTTTDSTIDSTTDTNLIIDTHTNCINNVEIQDNLKIHLKQIKNKKINKNLLQTDFPIAFNVSDNLEHNIMYNYGIKDKNKRQQFEHQINNTVIPSNKNLLLKNYNKDLFNYF